MFWSGNTFTLKYPVQLGERKMLPCLEMLDQSRTLLVINSSPIVFSPLPDVYSYSKTVQRI